MGYLHDGHASLIERARDTCRTVVVSIFVNPTQFGPHEDFSRYPRDVPSDLDMCERVHADVVFVPTVAEIYPAGHLTFVDVEGLGDRWEGASRPGHFRGVSTVVTLLFRMVRPDFAFFGEKDYQQLQIVRRLSLDLQLDVEIVGCPTIREPDGLASSSRNVYLSREDRNRATALHRGLVAAQRALAEGQSDSRALEAVMAGTILETPGAVLDYAAVVAPDTLEPVDQVTDEARALIAVHLGGVHLIDNAPLKPPNALRQPRRNTGIATRTLGNQ
jgi:pantoate--beta-alanine ligase